MDSDQLKLTKYSRHRLMETAAKWEVPKDYFDPIYNYLIHGFEPGSFFTSLLANDAFGAIQRSHPANTIEALKRLTGWIRDSLPPDTWGSYERVRSWLAKSAEDRRRELELAALIYSEHEEVEMALRGTVTREPYLY